MSTVSAISTPLGSGGLGVIRISGEDAIITADRVFRSVSGKKLSEIPGYTSLFGHIYEGDDIVDECVAQVFRAPKSYTGENVVELSCHGGIYVLKKTLRLTFLNGAVPAGPGEFTKRAFLNGKIDLPEAESVMSIIKSKGEESLKAAINVRDGSLSKKIDKVAEELVNLSAAMAVFTDDPDEEQPLCSDDNIERVLNFSINELKYLIKTYDGGKIITEGVETVITGKPNVGKSALMNALSGRDRSIVTEIEGATRDIIEDSIKIGEIILKLSDTAGLRESKDEIESIGIKRSLKKIDESELVFAVFDGSKPLDERDIFLLEKCKNKKAVAVINKSDLPRKIDEKKIYGYIKNIVFVSALNGTGLDELKSTLEKTLNLDEIDFGAGVLANERQFFCAKEALDFLTEAECAFKEGVTMDALNVLIDDAIEKLKELTGETARDAVIDKVFSEFCVGK